MADEHGRIAICARQAMCCGKTVWTFPDDENPRHSREPEDCAHATPFGESTLATLAPLVSVDKKAFDAGLTTMDIESRRTLPSLVDVIQCCWDFPVHPWDHVDSLLKKERDAIQWCGRMTKHEADCLIKRAKALEQFYHDLKTHFENDDPEAAGLAFNRCKEIMDETELDE